MKILLTNAEVFLIRSPGKAGVNLQ